MKMLTKKGEYFSPKPFLSRMNFVELKATKQNYIQIVYSIIQRSKSG